MLGFIILRHVRCKKTNLLWMESIRCIRKLYSNPILVIDDNSNYEFVTDASFPNVTIVQSEFHGRGELLPYYYFHKLKPFDKAVIIHDGVFIQKYIDFESIEDVKFLWHFHHQYDITSQQYEKLSYLKNNQFLIELNYSPDKWVGCFGGMSCITHEFLSNLVEKYDIFILLDHIKNRDDRMNFERLIAVLCTSIQPKVSSIFGTIYEHIEWGYTFDRYLNETIDNPIVKVWSGR